jgi:fatty-acid desaturase
MTRATSPDSQPKQQPNPQLKQQSKQQSKQQWNKTNLFWIVAVHLVALAAIPFFTWSALIVCLVGIFIFAPLGINVGYHRLLTHRGFKCDRWLRNTLITIGSMIGAGPPVHWAAMHRVHHRFSDTAADPHDSTRGFWYSHVMHLFVIDDHEQEDYLVKYAPDLMKDKYLQFLNVYGLYLALAVMPVLYYFGGISWVLWGGFVRTVCTWHIMWFVNSASHMWGYRNYETKDSTVNCWWVGLLAAGEGWHNNHHANPACAKHGHRWWEFDLSFQFIRAFEFLGWVRGVKRPVSFVVEDDQNVLPSAEFAPSLDR